MKPQARWELRKNQILGQMAPADVTRLRQSSREIKRETGEAIFLEGDDETPKVYVVNEGYVRVCKISDDGRRFIVSVLGPGEFMGAVVPGISTAEDDEFLEVVRDVRLIELDASVFHEILTRHPQFSLRLAQLIEEKKRDLNKRLTGMLFKDTCARVVDLLVEMADKYGEVLAATANGKPVAYPCIALTHQEVADMVGATRPVVSKILSQLLKVGYIQKNGRFLCLTNMPMLEKTSTEGSKLLDTVGI